MWALKMLSIPYGPVEVARLADIKDFSNLEASRLVPFLAGADGQREMAYLLQVGPQSSSSLGGIPILRPSDSSWSGLASRSSLSTDRKGDIDILSKAFPDHDFQTGVSNKAKTEDIATKTESKIEGKYKMATGWAMTHLLPYTSIAWKEFKEAQFTGMITKLMDLKTEAAMADAGHIVDSLQSWAEALSKGKQLTKRQKEYGRSAKTANFLALSPYIEEWTEFLLQQKMDVHWSLSSLCFKVRFLGAGNGKSMAERLDDLWGRGLEKVMLQIDKADDHSLVDWARGMIFQHIALVIEGMDVEHAENQREPLMTDLKECVDFLRNVASPLQE